MEARQRFSETCEQILREQLPNLFRLYPNPYVAQTCLCLERYIQDTWHAQAQNPEPYQSFLANSFDEALSGAIKLARYCASVAGKSTTGLVIDPTNCLGPFATTDVRGARVEFLPGLMVVGSEYAAAPGESFGFVVLVNADLDAYADRIRTLIQANAAHLILCVDRDRLARARASHPDLTPDIVIFDESFVQHDVPFGAFAARKALYAHWNQPAKSTFHSTTFQPNTISTLHFMKCLQRDDPQFHAKVADDLRLIETDIDERLKQFRRLYSPSLATAISATGCSTPNVRAAGSFVYVDDRKIFDGVSGVACSVRGHNPPTYAEEMDGLADVDCEAELATRLRALTGIEHMLPAVSGASAVENTLKAGLVAQFPRRHILALKSGFGGKTLVALAGTWNTVYKEHIGPLYEDVLYVDPFAPNAIEQIDAALRVHPVAVVQMELIQGVGGVRRVPENVVRHLDEGRSRHGYLLLVDEVQTGMYRTGPFTLSSSLGLTPDLLVVGKAVSDMMFPFALTLYSQKVQDKLDQAGSNLPDAIRRRNAYPFGYKTAVNALRFAEAARLAEQVSASGELIAKLLGEQLTWCRAVREVRVYGLLIGIELDASRWPQCWFKKRLFWFYLASMLRHPRFPVLVGFCQYEPNVLKITPPLTVSNNEIQQMCATIAEVLHRPFYRLVGSAVGGMLRSVGLWSTKNGHAHSPAHAPAVR